MIWEVGSEICWLPASTETPIMLSWIMGNKALHFTLPSNLHSNKRSNLHSNKRMNINNKNATQCFDAIINHVSHLYNHCT